MASNKRNPATTPRMVSITLATLAALSVIAALMLGGMIAQAQSGNGAVPNLRLSSAAPANSPFPGTRSTRLRQTTGLSGQSRT